MRRVQERERKRLRRRTLGVVRTRGVARIARRDAPTSAAASGAVTATRPAGSLSVGEISRVRNSRPDWRKVLSSHLTPDVRTAETTNPHCVEEAHHDRETTAHPRPRPPPAS